MADEIPPIPMPNPLLQNIPDIFGSGQEPNMMNEYPEPAEVEEDPFGFTHDIDNSLFNQSFGIFDDSVFKPTFEENFGTFSSDNFELPAIGSKWHTLPTQSSNNIW